MGWLLGLFGGSSIGLWIAGGLLALGIGAWGTQTWRLHEEETAHAQDNVTAAKREQEASNRALAAEQHERLIEQNYAQRLQEEVTNATTKRLAAADAAASAADTAARGLRDRVATLVANGRRACFGPTPAGGGASAPDSIMVLADVLGRADARAGLLAAEADRRRERALACEDAYEIVRDRQARETAEIVK